MVFEAGDIFDLHIAENKQQRLNYETAKQRLIFQRLIRD